MPEQTFRVMGQFPSGKTREVEVKLVNFRADPDNPDDMDTAHYWINKLTPPNFSVDRASVELVHDNPQEDLGTRGVDQLVNRPVQLQTETTKTVPVDRRPTKGVDDAQTPPRVSRGVPETDTDRGDRPGSLGDEGRPGGVDKSTDESKTPKPTRGPTGDQKR